MNHLSEIADAATMKWLLENNNPSVRYFALTKLQNVAMDHLQVIGAKNEIMISGLVPKLLEKQKPDGFWGEEKRFYLDKYKGSAWQLILLAELAADSGDERVRRACEFILEHSFDRTGFGFSVNESGKVGGGRHSEVIPCLTGNMVFSLIELGFLNDERVQKAIHWICQYQRCDDGVSGVPKYWPYDRFESCWGKHSCFMGVIKSLKALAAIPTASRSDLVNHKIQELTEYVLSHHIYKKSHNLETVSKPGWLRFGFPLMYQSDVLEILEILINLGCKDVRMQSAIDLLRSKQNAEKRWILENSFNGRMIHNVEVKGENSKWITLRAVHVLSEFY